MLAILLSGFWVHLVIDQQLKKTLCVGSFNEWILGSIVNLPVIKADTIC